MKGEDRISIKLLDEDGKIMASPKIPLDITVNEFIEAAIEHFKLPRKTDKGESISYDIAINNAILDRSKTFKQLGVKNGTCITLRKTILKERTTLHHPYFIRGRKYLVAILIFSFLLGLFCGNLLPVKETTTRVISVTTTTFITTPITKAITIYITETKTLEHTVIQTVTKTATAMKTVTLYTSAKSLSYSEITYSETMIKSLKDLENLRKDIANCLVEYLAGVISPEEALKRLELLYKKLTVIETSLPSPPPKFTEVHESTLKGIHFVKEVTFNCIDFVRRKNSLAITECTLKLMNYDLFISILEDLWRHL